MKRQMAKVAASIVVAALAGEAFALREISFMTAMPAKSPPVVDGAVDDACWKDGVANTTYYEFNKVNPKKYAYPTSCTVIYDEKGIYVGVVNFDPSMKTLKRNVVKHNDPDTWTDDSAEIYFDAKANGESYYKYVVNSAGKCDTAWRMDAANYHSGWLSPGRQVAAKMFDDRWEFELFIPWEDFHGLAKPDAGTVWTFAHLRFRFASGQPELSSSSPGAAGAAPQNFGYLYFSDGAPVEPQKVLDIVKARAKPVWGMEIGGKTYLCDAKGLKTIDCTLEELSRRDAEEKRARDEKAKDSLKKMLSGGDDPVDPLPLPLAGTYDFAPPKDYDGYNGFYRHNPDPMKYATAHHPWRTDGSFRPRVLFLTGFDATLRDSVELAERFPIEASYFPGNFGATGIYQDPISLGGFIDKERQFESLLARNPEIVVFNGFMYDKLPVHYKAEVLRRVRDEGVGLVVLSRVYLARGDFAKLKKCRAYARGEQAFRLGKGVVLLAGAPGEVPAWSLSWKAQYERRAAYCWNLLRRARGLAADEEIAAEGEALVAAASDAGGLSLEGEEAVPEGGALRVSAKLAKAFDVAAVLEAELATSPHGDVVRRWRRALSPGEASAALEYDGGDFPTLAGVVSARVVAAEDGRELARAKRIFFFPNHRYQDYTMISWDGTRGSHTKWDGDFTELFGPQLVDMLGYDNHLGGDFRTSAAYNSWIVPYRCRINIDKAKGSRAVRWEIISRAGFMVPFENKEMRDEVKALGEEMNPYDPRVRSIVERGFGEIVRKTLPYGVSAWNLGDECYFSLDAGHGEQDKRPFAEFLAWKYGTVEKFNAVHGTKCATFADAPHLTVQQAIDAGDRPAWWDHVQYMEKMYRDTMEFVSSVIKKYDPKARVGAEGSVPGDLELTVRNLEFWGPYRNLVGDELLRNVAPNHLRGVWWGGYISSLRDGFPVQMWEYLLTGTVNADQFFQCQPGGTLSAFGGDLAPAPYVQRMVPHLRALKRGVAQMLIRTPFRSDGFALYHSHASASAARLVDTFRTPEATLAPLIRFCYRTGYAVRMVTPHTLGRLDGVKALFLSGATVLSDAEVAALKAFAAKGGVIVSDVETGMMDEFFVSRENSPLAGVVGKMPDVADDRAVQSFLSANGIAANPESVEGLPSDGSIFRVREADGCRIVGFKSTSKALGSHVVVRFGRKCRVYEVDRGFVGETDRVEIESLDVPFKLYAAFDGEPEFFRKGAVYRREVIAPGGMPVAHREKVFVYDGELPAYTPPLNDAAGEWKLLYRDIATGRTVAMPLPAGLGPLPGFAIELFDGKTGTVAVASGESAAPDVTRTGGRTRICWRGHPRLGEGFTATAEGVERGGATEWTFSCSGNDSGLPIGRIAFPVVDVPCADNGHLLYSPDAGGGTMGWKRRVDWKSLPNGRTVASTMSPGFRFVAVLNGEGRDSYYLDVRDPETNAGRFEVRKGPRGTARLAWVHDLPLTPASAAAYRLPFTATVRAYRGDWYEAASFYREWAKTTPRFAAAKGRDMSKLRDVGLWMWNRGLAETVIPPVERFQSDTGLKVALDWYWWFKEMPGTFYPDYWPPREGAAKFKADVQRLKRAGVFTQVYLNGMTWDEDAPSWGDGGLASVAMRRDGSHFSCAYNRFNPDHHLANLCGEAPKFQSRIRGQIAHLVDCGFDSIYLDMIGCNAYGPCFNPAHRHAPGGGSHMTDDFRAYLKGVKAAFPGVLLSTEDCGEAYLDVFDSNISTHSSYERHGWIGTAPGVEFVPVFQAVYHGCAAVFGNYAIVDNVPYWDPRWPMKPWWSGHEDSLRRDYPDQFAVEFARGPAWGLQPSVHNFWIHHATNAAFASEYRFIRDTAKFYHDNREFLFDGEMRHPGMLSCASRKVSFAKVSVFDEKVASHASVLPTVFHNVWRSPGGKVAAILVNWTREPQGWRLKAPDVSSSGTLPPRSWARIVVRGHTALR